MSDSLLEILFDILGINIVYDINYYDCVILPRWGWEHIWVVQSFAMNEWQTW